MNSEKAQERTDIKLSGVRITVGVCAEDEMNLAQITLTCVSIHR